MSYPSYDPVGPVDDARIADLEKRVERLWCCSNTADRRNRRSEARLDRIEAFLASGSADRDAQKVYEFEIIIPGWDVTEEDAERLFDAGAGDCTPAVVEGTARLSFARKAASLAAAVGSAVTDVLSVGIQAGELTIQHDHEFEYKAGKSQPPAARHRTLVRAEGYPTDGYGADRVFFVIPAWRPDELVPRAWLSLPEEIRAALDSGKTRFHAVVDLGAESAEALAFSGWEVL